MSIGPCTEPTITPGTVVFDPSVFKTLYPAFATVPTAALNFNFAQAQLMLNNSCCSAVPDAPTRELLLGLLTAHITALLNGVNGQAPSGVVGRISDAAQGSVNVSTELATAPVTSMTVAYLQQTQWGLQFLAATAQYRTMQYAAPPPRNYGPWPFVYEGWPSGCG